MTCVKEVEGDICGFSTRDQKLMDNHSCDVNMSNGMHEDWPCCGCEFGDCNGLLYGSDKAIKEQAIRDLDNEDGGYDYDDDWDEE